MLETVARRRTAAHTLNLSADSHCVVRFRPPQPFGSVSTCSVQLPAGGRAIPRRIAFINEKGGSGKTTLVGNIAAYLALKCDQRVLVIDMDPQGQLGKVLGIDVRRQRHSVIELLVDSILGSPGPSDRGSARPSDKLPAMPTRIPGLDAIIANKSLALFPAWTGVGDDDPTLRLHQALQRAPEVADYDYLLFDAPPSFGPLTLNVLRASTEVVIPVPLTYLALDGSAEFLRTLETVRTRYGHPGLSISMVIPTFYRRTRLANEILSRLRERFDSKLSETVVGYHVKIDEAQSRGLSIFEHAPRDRGAQAMASLAQELIEREPPPPTKAKEMSREPSPPHGSPTPGVLPHRTHSP